MVSACSLAVGLHGASYSEVRERIHPGQQIIQEVRLGDVVNTPQAYTNTRVRFRCIFAESGNLFDEQHSFFKPYTHANLIVWGERAPIWDPQVRSQPLSTVYIAKDRVDASRIATLNKYQFIEVVGEVAMIIDGVPFISVHAITPIDMGGTLSDTAVYHTQQAVQLGAEGARDLAEDHYNTALAENLPLATKVQIGHLRGQNLLLAGDYVGCTKVMREVLNATERDNELDRRQLASMHFLFAKAQVELEGTNEQAVTHARRAVELDPEQGDAYAVLGITLAGAGQFDEARRQCEKAIRLRPTNAEVRWYLGRILDQQGAYDEAIDALRKAIDLTPKDGRLHKAIAATYLHRGQKAAPAAMVLDYSAALQEFGIAVRLSATDAEALYGVGVVVEEATRRKIAELTVGTTKVQPTMAMAVERYRAAIAADGNFLPGRRALANHFRAEKKTDEAIAQYKAIIELDPTRSESWTDLGSYYWSMDKKDDTYALYQKFLSLNPTSSAAKLAVAATAAEVGKSAEGVPLVEQVLDSEPDNAHAWLVMAKLQMAQGLAKQARKCAIKAEERFTNADGKAKAQQIIQQAEAMLNAK
jgi:tetratricopeptide (TPR) repeat protein